MSREVPSPCVKVCTLDASGGTCIGCLRSLDEIAQWGGLTDAERARVIAELPERRRRFDGARAVAAPACCPNCGAEFHCGAADPHNACWCSRFPPVAPSPGTTSCLCPECLAAALTRGSEWASG